MNYDPNEHKVLADAQEAAWEALKAAAPVEHAAHCEAVGRMATEGHSQESLTAAKESLEVFHAAAPAETAAYYEAVDAESAYTQEHWDEIEAAHRAGPAPQVGDWVECFDRDSNLDTDYGTVVSADDTSVTVLFDGGQRRTMAASAVTVRDDLHHLVIDDGSPEQEYEVSIAGNFRASCPEDAVRQMVEWLNEHAGLASYRVVSEYDLDDVLFVDADDLS